MRLGRLQEPLPHFQAQTLAELIALVLVVGSVWIMERLLETGKIQDCVWQGRKNCAPISAPPR